MNIELPFKFFDLITWIEFILLNLTIGGFLLGYRVYKSETISSNVKGYFSVWIAASLTILIIVSCIHSLIFLLRGQFTQMILRWVVIFSPFLLSGKSSGTSRAKFEITLTIIIFVVIDLTYLKINS